MSTIDWLNSEEQILVRIVANTQNLANAIDFVLVSAFPENPYRHHLHIAVNVPRIKLGLKVAEKPGDIDLLIVPFLHDQLLAHDTMAIEAKIIRPTFENPGRNANSMGHTQVTGLARDGFPYVGLLHISVPASLPENLHWQVPLISGQLDQEGKLIEIGKRYEFDPFPLLSADRQEGRLQALKLGRHIAYSSHAITLSADKQRITGNTMGNSKGGTRNPRQSDCLVSNIERLLREAPQIFKTIRWCDKPS